MRLEEKNSLVIGDGRADTPKQLIADIGTSERPSFTFDPIKNAWVISNGLDQPVVLVGSAAEEVMINDTDGNIEFDLSKGRVFYLTLEGNATFSFVNPGKYKSYIICITNGGVGNHEVSLPSDLKFQGLSPNLKYPSEFVPKIEISFIPMGAYYSANMKQIV